MVSCKGRRCEPSSIFIHSFNYLLIITVLMDSPDYNSAFMVPSFSQWVGPAVWSPLGNALSFVFVLFLFLKHLLAFWNYKMGIRLIWYVLYIAQPQNQPFLQGVLVSFTGKWCLEMKIWPWVCSFLLESLLVDTARKCTCVYPNPQL